MKNSIFLGILLSVCSSSYAMIGPFLFCTSIWSSFQAYLSLKSEREAPDKNAFRLGFSKSVEDMVEKVMSNFVDKNNQELYSKLYSSMDILKGYEDRYPLTFNYMTLTLGCVLLYIFFTNYIFFTILSACIFCFYHVSTMKI